LLIKEVVSPSVSSELMLLSALILSISRAYWFALLIILSISSGDSVIEFSPSSYYADTFLEDEENRQGNILNNRTKEIGQSLMLLIKEGNSEAVIRDLVLSSHFSTSYNWMSIIDIINRIL
jgi:hypothetical protein